MVCLNAANRERTSLIMSDAVLYIYTSSYMYTPNISGTVTLTTERAGAPGRLNFKVVKDDVISFQEGDKVTLHYGDVDVFCGYVFKKQRSSDGLINVTAFDQLRYFKNKDTYSYSGLTATELIKRIAADCGMSCGQLSDTGYSIPARVESGVSLMDIAQTAIDLTYEATGNLFVLYDEFGALRLSNVEEMVMDLLICSGSAGDFDYTSSIDEETFNYIKLAYEDGNSGETVFYCASDADLIKKWGKLQYYGKVESGEDGPALAESRLNIYGSKTRKLRISDMAGDNKVRAGCLLPVQMDLGDLDFNSFLLAEKVVHTYQDDVHGMDLTLVGGEFIA